MDVLININSLIYRILNSNTTIDWLNNVTASFETTVNSQGWTALDTFVNTLGNSFSVYDAIGGGIERMLDRIRRRKEDKKKEEEDDDDNKEELHEELKSTMEMMSTKLKSIDELMGCFLAVNEVNDKGLTDDDCLMEALKNSTNSEEDDDESSSAENDRILLLAEHEKQKLNPNFDDYDGRLKIQSVKSRVSYNHPNELNNHAVNLASMLHVHSPDRPSTDDVMDRF